MSHKNRVYEYLLEAILSNELLPGTPIIESEVSIKMNVSRTPVREALKELVANGLVSQYHSRGTFVSQITPYDVEEIFSLRIMLEIFALQSAGDKITEEELKEVETLFLALNSDSSKEEYHKADTSLHQLIMDKAGNRRLKQFLNTLGYQIERFRRVAAIEPTRLSKSKKEHLDIINSLKEQDLKACEDSLRSHLLNVKHSTLEAAKMISMRDTK
ncbi:GntR family transcriptional regulator [Planococcus beigongshangi]|uniref:GntR family transcriptional regulator n=1 Tax=Planococcus beigongshangi TaxID=2782536 RepID=UPI00193BDD64|nr:GntR family transcriptional regulator [Planococcus beigongshangi]